MPNQPHHSHYLLECPRCRGEVESCGCRERILPRYPARLPCRQCCLIIAVMEAAKYAGNRARRKVKP